MDKGLISDLLKTPSQIRTENDQRRLTEGLAMAQLAQQGNTLGGVGGMFANFGAQQAAQTGRNISNAFRGVTDAIGTVTGADLRPADERAASAQQKAMEGLKMGNLQSMKAKRQELVNAGVPAAVIERLDSAIAKREAEVLQRSDTVQQRVQAQANTDRDFGFKRRAEERSVKSAKIADSAAKFALESKQDQEASLAAMTTDVPFLTSLGFSEERANTIATSANRDAFYPAVEARLLAQAEGADVDTPDPTASMQDAEAFDKALQDMNTAEANGDTAAFSSAQARAMALGSDLNVINTAQQAHRLKVSAEAITEANTAINETEEILLFVDSNDIKTGADAVLSDFLANTFGVQNMETLYRNKVENVKMKMIINNLPPGVASDKDVELVLRGAPPASASPEVIKQYVRGIQKLNEARKQKNVAFQEFMGDPRNMGNTAAFESQYNKKQKQDRKQALMAAGYSESEASGIAGRGGAGFVRAMDAKRGTNGAPLPADLNKELDKY